MKERRLMDQISAIFGIFMTVFYIGVGLYLIMANNLYMLDPFLRNIVGYTFLFYSLYRGYRSYIGIRKAFFTKENDEQSL